MKKFLKALFQRRPKVKKVDITRRFDLIARVGQGSMSKVWRARDTMSGKMVALKILDAAKTRKLEARFIGRLKPPEGEIAIQLQHPHIVRTLEHGVSTGREQFLVMDFIEGFGLSYLVEVQNDQMKKDRMRLMIQLGDAIDYFHKQHWIHRDICPRNVLIDPDGQVKLIDFGLAVPDTPEFRRPGNRTGTANYMAPELVKRQKTDQRIDIFSYAVTCYEMYTKRFPWDSTGLTLEMVLQHINRPPIDIRQLVPDIDEQIAETIMKGLALYPDDRWQSMSDMLVPLREARRRLEPDSDDEYEDADKYVEAAEQQQPDASST